MEQQNMTLMLDSFLHEIKNPLCNINGHLKLMEMSDPELTTSLKWSRIKRNIDHLQHLIEDFSSLNPGSVHVDTIDISELLLNVYDSYFDVAKEKGIHIKRCFDENLIYNGDATKFKQALINLVKNAVEACEPSDSICIGSKTTAECIDIYVKDTGCGMTDEQLDTCLTPYVSYKAHGTGLGLVQVNWVMEIHHGQLLVSSEKEVGSTFIMRFPTQA